MSQLSTMLKGKMFQYQSTLPKLPVPALTDTVGKYLKSVHPLLNKAQYAATEKAAKELVAHDGIGYTLQERLLKRANDPFMENWLYEWWNEMAYFAYREPVVPYVSYFFSFKDDPKISLPAKRAAAVTKAVLMWRSKVLNGMLEPDYLRKDPLCMHTYQYMFHACRVPGKVHDSAVVSHQAINNFFIVMRRGRFFKIDISHKGKELSFERLVHNFESIVRTVGSTYGPGIGALTSCDRDTWYKNYTYLRQCSVENDKIVKMIEGSAFVVCLDESKPSSLEERARQYWHGDGVNRWYDKPLQFIINDNGAAGFMGEHSMMDGTPTHRLNDSICRLLADNLIDTSCSKELHQDISPQELRFSMNGEIEKEIQAAKKYFASQVEQHDLRVQAYKGYGKKWIKKCGCSPDAYVQMLIQLAYYRVHGVCRPTYESASTRKYRLGRTETCRSVSDESVAFVRAMGSSSKNSSEVIRLARAAMKAHTLYLTDASAGRGVDRHLLGLKQMLQPGEELPALYKDPTYSYSSSWYLSTSQLSSEFFNGYGWSQVINDGFGIAYMINDHDLHFNIVSKKKGSDKMQIALADAAEAMKKLFEQEHMLAAKL